ncbi:MAG: hypothetical protein ACKPKO_32215, partial [Candidatus Fonsibacter sp.]
VLRSLAKAELPPELCLILSSTGCNVGQVFNVQLRQASPPRTRPSDVPVEGVDHVDDHKPTTGVNLQAKTVIGAWALSVRRDDRA